MFELNGVKYQHVFTPGRYPQGTFTDADCKSICAVYSPDLHESPLWIGHPGFFSDEPKALAWVQSLHFIDGKVYAVFNDISQTLLDLINNKEFKRCSVEIGKMKLADGKESYYIFAIGLTNRPAVSMPPLQFSSEEKKHKFNREAFSDLVSFNDDTSVITFELTNKNFSQTNNKKIMFAKLLALAAKLKIDVSAFQDESKMDDLLAKIEASYNDLGAKLEAALAETSNFAAQRANDLLAAAVDSGKVKPADKDKYLKFAQSNYDEAKAMFSAMPADPAMSSSNVAGSAGTGASGADQSQADKKFTDKDGKPLTYDAFLKYCREDVKFADKFTPADVDKLKKEAGL